MLKPNTGFQKAKRQPYLEAMRGLAALVVLVGHYLCAFYPAAIFGSVFQRHEKWEKLFTTTPLGVICAGQAAVCLFFILSGYVLSLPYFGDTAKDTNHLLAALLKRPFRLVGIVIASEITAFLLLQTRGYYNHEASKVSFSTTWLVNYGAPAATSFKRFLLDISTYMLCFTFMDSFTKAFFWGLWRPTLCATKGKSFEFCASRNARIHYFALV